MRNSVVLFDDFSWTIALNGNGLFGIECVKGLLTQKDESETRDMVMRVKEGFKIRHNAIKIGSCNCSSFDKWYGGEGYQLPAAHVVAVMRRCKFVSLHKFKLPSGEVVDLCPVMTDDKKRRFEACGYRITEEIEDRPETKQR